MVVGLGTPLIEDHLKIDYSAESAYVSALVAAAVQSMENELGYEYGSGTAGSILDCMPKQFTLPMDASRMSSVVITYIDKDETTQTLDTTDFHVSQFGYPCVITLASDFELSSLSETPFPVSVAWNVAAKTMTPAEEQALLFLVAHWYENREAVDKKMHQTPLAFSRIISQLKKSFIRVVGQSPSYLTR